jgi:hypothetical protein
MRQFILLYILLFIVNFRNDALAQKPSNNEAISLIITQKKASDPIDALPFTIAPGSNLKFYSGHYTSLHNEECIVVGSLLQGHEIIQVVLLLYKNKEGFWINGCWYYDNIYRLKVKDFNKDSILELILETKISAGNRSFGNYKIISLLNQNNTIWYENNSFSGIEEGTAKFATKGKEITKDIKASFIDTVITAPSLIQVRTISGKFNSYSDSIGVKLDYETHYESFKFFQQKYIPLIE